MTNRGGLRACAALLGACFLLVASGARAGLRVLAPPDGAVFDHAAVTLIGGGSTGSLEVTLNGQKLANLKQVGNAFTGPLTLQPGKNALSVRSGASHLEFTYHFQTGPKNAPGTYRYHDPVVGGDCKECHPQGVGRTSPVSESRLCRACHEPKEGKKYVHGPIGAGQCSVCHDPHGSAHKDLLTAKVRNLCVLCHDQDRSRTHIERAGTRPCNECHDPHGSDKQYLVR